MPQIYYCPADSPEFQLALLVRDETVRGKSLVTLIEECPRCAAVAKSILADDMDQIPGDTGFEEYYDEKIWAAISRGEQEPYPPVAMP